MTCPEARKMLDAWFDRELDVRTSLEVEEHIETCERCKTHLANLTTLRTALRDPALSHPIPAGLIRRIAPKRRVLWATGVGAALAAAAAVVLVVALPWGRQPPDVAADVLAAHSRSLITDHMMDVASTDQHTVKPWFQGKIDYSFPVNDFADKGFSLTGGRLDYLRDRPVAALVYHHAKHIVNMFIWPGTGKKEVVTRRGLSAIGWTQEGLRYWIVSDIPATDLENFRKMVRATAPP
jgi:anti-sigma factor RsiW